MKRPLFLLAVFALLLTVAACASGPPLPTATAIPLAATATLSPQPTRLPAQIAPTRAPATVTPTSPATGSGNRVQLDDRLAERAAADFLDRLVRGDADEAFTLYLTDAAWQEWGGPLLSRFTASNPRLVDASLLEFKRATAASYEARALLYWTDTGKRTTQTATLCLVYQRGLWLIDALNLGDM